MASTCFPMERHPHNIYDTISIDLVFFFFKRTFTVQRLLREPCLLEEILAMQVGTNYNNVLWTKWSMQIIRSNTKENKCFQVRQKNAYIRTICICPSSRHLPGNRLAAAVLPMMSKPLKVHDLRWSAKDFCSKNSLLEWDMPISIHQSWIHLRTPPFRRFLFWDLFIALLSQQFVLFSAATLYLTTFIAQLRSPVSCSLSLSIRHFPAWTVCACLLQKPLMQHCWGTSKCCCSSLICYSGSVCMCVSMRNIFWHKPQHSLKDLPESFRG